MIARAGQNCMRITGRWRLGARIAMAPAGRADSPPRLQVDTSLRGLRGAAQSCSGANKEACLADETTAQDTLKQNWSKYSATDKTQCVGMATTGGPASYVELLSVSRSCGMRATSATAMRSKATNASISTRRRKRK